MNDGSIVKLPYNGLGYNRYLVLIQTVFLFRLSLLISVCDNAVRMALAYAVRMDSGSKTGQVLKLDVRL